MSSAVLVSRHIRSIGSTNGFCSSKIARSPLETDGVAAASWLEGVSGMAAWEDNLEAARLADDAGIEFLLPVARWHGYGGRTDRQGTSFETFTWATGLLAATRDIVTFATVHTALINPVFAAKQVVTADHVGRG